MFFKKKTLQMTFCLLIISQNIAAFAEDISEVVEKILPAVVNISTTQKSSKKKGLGMTPENPYDLFREFLEKEFNLPEQMKKMTSLGSGFIINPEGYIVTNYHVIAGGDEINVMLSNDNEKSYKAKIIGQDQKTDLALLKIEPEIKLPYLEFGNSEEAKVGNAVIAVGNPFGLGGTVTSGIISAKARYITGENYDEYLQTDAAINTGNSGGPLCDGKTGKVWGVNSVIISPSGGNIGIGFAIPSAIVQPVVAQLQDKGTIVRGWLGVVVQPVDENLAKALGLDKAKGALVSSIIKDSPAYKGGLEVGDVIITFDGKIIDGINKLPRIVGETSLGKEVEVSIFRQGKNRKIKIKVAQPEKEDPFSLEGDNNQNTKEVKTVLGVKVSNLNEEIRKAYGIDSSATGVVVTDLEKNSFLAFTGIRTGDVILSVNQKPIKGVEDFEQAFEEIKKTGKGSAAILVSRKGMNQFFGVEIK
jgi:serine protease Do